jgi:hypothetical protein
MSRRGIAQEAPPGSLEAGPLNDLIVLRQFELNRDKVLARLFGVKLRRSRLREEMLRILVIEFGLGHTRQVSFFIKECKALGSASAVRLEISRLCSLGLTILRDDPEDARSARVVPTQKIISFYNTQMPRISPELEDFLVNWG